MQCSLKGVSSYQWGHLLPTATVKETEAHRGPGDMEVDFLCKGNPLHSRLLLPEWGAADKVQRAHM